MKRLLTALLCGMCLGSVRADQGRPAALQNVGIDQRLDETVPLDLKFRNEQGESVELGHFLKKRPVVLALVYYECPMLCTLELNGLVKAMRMQPYPPGEQYEVVTVSFNPRETPALAAAKKKEYLAHLARPGSDSGWHFLTGDEAAIRQLTRAVGYRYQYDDSTRQFAHAAGLVILTPEGRISRYFFGVDYSPRDLRLALAEASDNRVGSPVDALLLFCFHYDPSTGKYGLAVSRVLQLSAALTVLALGGYMSVMLWKERRREAT